MVIRQTPSDLNKYIAVKFSISPKVTQETKQRPLYMDNDYIYYKKTLEVESVVKKYEQTD